MRNVWKFVVFACLVMQFGYAYPTNQHSVPTSQKESENTLNKERFGTSKFLRPSIERGTLEVKNNIRIPFGVSYCPTEFQSLSNLKRQNLKIVVFDQDNDRCRSIFTFLFPHHCYW